MVSARKCGVAEANGDYITFVDCDDWIEKTFYSKLINIVNCKLPDIITSGTIWEFSDRRAFKQIDSLPPGNYDLKQISERIIPQMLYSWETGRQGITASVWNKLYKRECINQTYREVSEKITIGEDALLTYLTIMDAGSIVITDICGYHYRQHNQSMCHKVTGDVFDRLELMIISLEKSFTERGYKYEFLVQRENFLKPYLYALGNRMFNLSEMKNYIPPMYIIPKNSRVAIYGAGYVGRFFYRIIFNSMCYKIVGWYDKNFIKLSKYMPILNPVDIKENELDYIIIAIADQTIASEVKSKLREKIISKKIIWYRYIMF